MKLQLLTLNNFSILKQLEIEEALLRTDSNNWCIINHGSPKHIVLGNSSEPSELINLPLAKERNVPIIHRFSGGGTVIVDEDTLFVTFILQSPDIGIAPFPKEILHWTGELYQQALALPQFQVTENDYTIGNKKIGGNAQYLRKERFLHHTSFLWDFNNENMELLLHPKRQPSYRNERPHKEFLTPLKPLLTKEEFFKRLLTHLSTQYELLLTPLQSTFPNHRKTTKLLPL